MRRVIAGTLLILCGTLPASSQPAESRPRFEAVDAKVGPKTNLPFPFPRTSTSNGRYGVRTATMVDLIRLAYGFDNDKILGGPSWLEMDRFEIAGKVPANSTPEMHKQMLQAALEDRFQLKVRKETKPLPRSVLAAGSQKHKLKEAEGTETPGCRPQQSSGGPAEGAIRLMTAGRDGGAPATFTLGPGGTIRYECRNISMAAFAAGIRTMLGASLSITGDVLDETGLKGNWNFDVQYSVGLIGPGPMGAQAERVPFPTAVEKQLGLKMEERQVPTEVIVVEACNREPSPNPPGTAEALPPIPIPKEFEVATLKPVTPDMRMGGFRTQPGGRVVMDGMPLQFLISRAFNAQTNEQIVGMPPFATDRYDLNAKLSTEESTSGPMDMEAMAPLFLSLLQERFKLKYHTEERPLDAYTLVAAKPKMKKADPASRAFCRNVNNPPGAPQGARALTCQNVTMDQLAERLRGLGPALQWPVQNATGIEGGWDFTLTFSMQAMMMMGGGGRGAPMPLPPPGMTTGGGGGAALPGTTSGLGSDAGASDPSGGLTVFDAIEKQLGLKLEKKKRPMTVFVIDHMDPKPSEN